MVVLPYDVLVLIADHFEPSELLGLAAFHRYFLHEHLIRRYQDPVVLTDHLQAQSQNNIEADLSRIRGPLVCHLIERIELRTEQLAGGQQPWTPWLTHFQQFMPWSPAPLLATNLLHPFDTLYSLRSLHLTESYIPGIEAADFSPPPKWRRLLPEVWPELAPRLEELHLQGHPPMLVTVAGLNPLLCEKLSVLCINSSRILYSYHNITAAVKVVDFINALSYQLVSIGLLGDEKSLMPHIIDGVQYMHFPHLRALYADLTQGVDHLEHTSWDTFVPIANLLVRHEGHVRSISLRHRSHQMREVTTLKSWLDLIQRCGIVTSLRRLDIDMGKIIRDYHGTPTSWYLDDQRLLLNSIQRIPSLEDLRLRPAMYWIPDPRNASGSISSFSPLATFQATPRIFSTLKKLSVCVVYLRAQLFEEVAQATPRLEKVVVEFQELWHPLQDSAPRYTASYTPEAAAEVFAVEIKDLHHLQTMQLQHLQLNWKADRKAMSLKQEILAMLRENIASLRYPSGVVEFVQSPKTWQENLRWIDCG